MDIAHDLFCSDSSNILSYLAVDRRVLPAARPPQIPLRNSDEIQFDCPIPVSSASSRTAACRAVSPGSRTPPGSSHCWRQPSNTINTKSPNRTTISEGGHGKPTLPHSKI
jgi:hypothetical protein